MEEVGFSPVSYDPALSGFDRTDAGDDPRVQVKVRLAVAGSRNAPAVLDLAPEHRQIIRERISIEPPYVVVHDVRPTDAAKLLSAVQANIDQLARDIDRHNPRLREYLEQVVAQRKHEIARADAARADQLEALRESGLRDLSGVQDVDEQLAEEPASKELPVTPDGVGFLSSVSATLAAGDPKAFQAVVEDVINRMHSIEQRDDLFDLTIRLHAKASAASLEIVRAGLVGEIPPERAQRGLQSFVELLAELAVLGVQLKNPELSLVIRAGLLISKFTRNS